MISFNCSVESEFRKFLIAIIIGLLNFVQELVIEPGSVTYKQLLNPTVPLFKDIYFFNLTNPDDFQNGATPDLNEVGPYSYR